MTSVCSPSCNPLRYSREDFSPMYVSEIEGTTHTMKIFFKNLLVILFMSPLSYYESLSSSFTTFYHFQSIPSLSCPPPSNTRVIFSARMFHQGALWACHGCPAKLHFNCLWRDSVWQLPLVCLSLLSAVCCHPLIIHNSSAELWYTNILSKQSSANKWFQF